MRQTLTTAINSNLELSFENLKLSRQWQKKFKKEELGKEMVAADLRTIEILTGIKTMKFVKGEHFKINGQRYKVISGIFHETRFPTFPGNEIGNCVEFIGIKWGKVSQPEFGEEMTISEGWEEIRPEEIKANGKPLNEMQEIHNEYVRISGVKLYPKTFLHSLIEKGELIIE